MYKIIKEFSFCASHHLEGLPDTHPCSRDHGHNYVIKVELSDIKLNDIGFVCDYRKLDAIKQLIDETLDHRNLNDVFLFNPTAENIAKELFKTFKERFPQLSAIEVSETPKTNCKYTPDYDDSK